jgi:ubiquinone/menaquinone biosynthesis C-methylase UbiE
VKGLYFVLSVRQDGFTQMIENNNPLVKILTKQKFIQYIFVFIILFSCVSELHSQYTYPERNKWQKPHQVIKCLDIKPGSTVADIGVGDGYFIFRLANAVTQTGKAYAVDISDYHIKQIEKEAQKRNIPWIEVIKAKTMDPCLTTRSVDLVFICNTYHHLKNRITYFKKLKKTLKPMARIAIIDYLPQHAPFPGHGTSTVLIINEMREAGFFLEKQYDFLPRQNFLVFIEK